MAEERGLRASSDRDPVKFMILPFPFSSKLKIWSFHVVVGRDGKEMYRKA